jgi:hypothetical protein
VWRVVFLVGIYRRRNSLLTDNVGSIPSGTLTGSFCGSSREGNRDHLNRNWVQSANHFLKFLLGKNSLHDSCLTSLEKVEVLDGLHLFEAKGTIFFLVHFARIKVGFSQSTERAPSFELYYFIVLFLYEGSRLSESFHSL